MPAASEQRISGWSKIEVDLANQDILAERRRRLVGDKGQKNPFIAPHTLTKEQWPPDYSEVYAWRKRQLEVFEEYPQDLLNAKAFYKRGKDASWEGCVAFINHWCDTFDTRETTFGDVRRGKSTGAWMPFIMFKRQEELVRFIIECLEDDQAGLVEKCRTMGATWLCVAISVWLWLFHPGTSIGWGSQKAENVDEIGNPKSIFWKMRELINRLPPCFKPEVLSDSDIKQGLCHNPLNGSTIVGEVGDDIGRGGRTRVFFKDESAHYLHPELIESAISENTRVPIDISSVNGLGNLFHRKREAGIDWYPGKKIEPGYIRVFVMDSHDHPEYDDVWHKTKKAYHERQGTPHVYAQEIERNYAASVQGTIIPHDWLEKCIDAHVKLNIDRGPKISALDIGDAEDGDRNAQSIREGIILTYCDEWVARDPGVTARKAMGLCTAHQVRELQYDAAGGLGSNVKSEVNRLKDENAFPRNFRVVPWNAGGKVLLPLDPVNKGDKDSPRNKDFFTNLKAQAWWHLRLMVYNTYALITALEEGGKLVPREPHDNEVSVAAKDGTTVTHNVDELFSLASSLPLLQKVIKELCQATASHGAKLKLLVDKAPDGTRSPNLADSIVMAYWPMPANIGEFTDLGLGAKIFRDGVRIR